MKDEVSEVSAMAEEPKTSPGTSGPAPDENVSVTLLVVRQLDRIDDRFDRLERDLGQIRGDLGQVRSELGQRIDRLDQRIDGLYLWTAGTIAAIIVGAGAVVVTLLTHHP